MKNLLWAILLLVSCHSYAQNTKAVKDTLIWTDGTRYTGTIIKADKKTGQVQFMTEDSQMHNVSASSIALLKWVNPPVEDNTTPAEKKEASAVKRAANQDPDRIHWSDPNIPHKILVRHRVGIGLAVSGAALFLTGFALVMAGAFNSQSVSTPTSTELLLKPIAIPGFFLVGAGLPIMIVGIIKNFNSQKQARAALIHFN